MAASISRDPGSYRDPAGQVYVLDNCVIRIIRPPAADQFHFIKDQNLIDWAVKEGWLIGSRELSYDNWPPGLEKQSIAAIVEHDRIPFISYPYEWSFEQLKAAALHHLDFQIELLALGAVLKDASAYNIQFLGVDPIFIDLLSIDQYQEGQYWTGQSQFCEQFLNPLLLRAKKGIPHNAWYRGNLEGISSEDCNAVLGLRDKFSLNVFLQVTLLARMNRKSRTAPDDAISKAKSSRKLSKSAYLGILTNLRRWIAKLEPKFTGKTTWSDYSIKNTYQSDEKTLKEETVSNFVRDTKPATFIDLGCNSGDYCAAALKNGASHCVGFDFDQNAISLAFNRAKQDGMNLLPLLFDAVNPSPDQGWNQSERKGFGQRAKSDAVVALAFIHHLIIARNVPMDEVVKWITSIAPKGLIEFVPKNDPTVQIMLSLREDIFPDYTQENFEKILKRFAKICNETQVNISGRTIYEFQQ